MLKSINSLLSLFYKLMQRIIDISSDKIAIYGSSETLFLERNGVDLELGKVLVELDQKEERTKIAVLNGP